MVVRGGMITRISFPRHSLAYAAPVAGAVEGGLSAHRLGPKYAMAVWYFQYRTRRDTGVPLWTKWMDARKRMCLMRFRALVCERHVPAPEISLYTELVG